METHDFLQQYKEFKIGHLEVEKEYLDKTVKLKEKHNWVLALLYAALYVHVMTQEGMGEYDKLKLEFSPFTETSGLEALDVIVLDADEDNPVYQEIVELQTLVDIMEKLPYDELLKYGPENCYVGTREVWLDYSGD